MRLSLRRRTTGPLTQDEAWFCCSSNFVLPGSGSLLGGRWSGYAQLLLALIGFGLTTWYGIRFIAWTTHHWSELWSPDNDPVEMLAAIWNLARWIALGFVTFAAAWLWAATTSIALLRTVRRQQAEAAATSPPTAPPVISN
jgi:hypothetical protein